MKKDFKTSNRNSIIQHNCLSVTTNNNLCLDKSKNIKNPINTALQSISNCNTNYNNLNSHSNIIVNKSNIKPILKNEKIEKCKIDKKPINNLVNHTIGKSLFFGKHDVIDEKDETKHLNDKKQANKKTINYNLAKCNKVKNFNEKNNQFLHHKNENNCSDGKKECETNLKDANNQISKNEIKINDEFSSFRLEIENHNENNNHDEVNDNNNIKLDFDEKSKDKQILHKASIKSKKSLKLDKNILITNDSYSNNTSNSNSNSNENIHEVISNKIPERNLNGEIIELKEKVNKLKYDLGVKKIEIDKKNLEIENLNSIIRDLKKKQSLKSDSRSVKRNSDSISNHNLNLLSNTSSTYNININPSLVLKKSDSKSINNFILNILELESRSNSNIKELISILIETINSLIFSSKSGKNINEINFNKESDNSFTQKYLVSPIERKNIKHNSLKQKDIPLSGKNTSFNPIVNNISVNNDDFNNNLRNNVQSHYGSKKENKYININKNISFVDNKNEFNNLGNELIDNISISLCKDDIVNETINKKHSLSRNINNNNEYSSLSVEMFNYYEEEENKKKTIIKNIVKLLFIKISNVQEVLSKIRKTILSEIKNRGITSKEINKLDSCLQEYSENTNMSIHLNYLNNLKKDFDSSCLNITKNRASYINKNSFISELRKSKLNCSDDALYSICISSPKFPTKIKYHSINNQDSYFKVSDTKNDFNYILLNSSCISYKNRTDNLNNTPVKDMYSFNEDSASNNDIRITNINKKNDQLSLKYNRGKTLSSSETSRKKNTFHKSNNSSRDNNFFENENHQNSIFNQIKNESFYSISMINKESINNYLGFEHPKQKRSNHTVQYSNDLKNNLGVNKNEYDSKKEGKYSNLNISFSNNDHFNRRRFKNNSHEFMNLKKNESLINSESKRNLSFELETIFQSPINSMSKINIRLGQNKNKNEYSFEN